MSLQIGRTQLCTIYTNQNDTTFYNYFSLEKLESGIDIDRLKDAINKVISIHPSLRTKFKLSRHSAIVQDFTADVHARIISLSDNDFKTARKSLVTPIVLFWPPLARFEIYHTPSGNYYYQQIHMSICDAASLDTLAKAIEAAYNGEQLKPEKYSIENFIHDELSTDYAAATEYYKNLMQNYHFVYAPSRDVYKDTRKQKWHSRDITLNNREFSRFRQACNADVQSFFSAVIGFVIGKYQNNEHVSIGVNIPRVPREDTRDSIAPFNHSILLLLNPNNNKKVADYLRSTSEILLNCSKYTGFSIIDSLYLGSKCELTFAYLDKTHNNQIFSSSTPMNDSLNLESCVQDTPLFITITREDAERYRLLIGYWDDMYSSSLIRSLGDSITLAAREFLSCDCLGDIDLLSDYSRNRLAEFNATEKEFDTTATVVSLLRENAERNPDKAALVYQDKTLSYREFDRITDKIAAYLTSKGIREGKIVGVLLSRNEYMAVAPWSVVKTGAAYLLLDPALPRKHLNYLISDSTPSLLITEKNLRDLANEYTGDILYLEDIDGLPEKPPVSLLPKPEDIFCVSYTTGTSGLPKGCVIEHRNFISNYHSFCAYMQLDESDRFATVTGYSLDTSIRDIFAPITCGATLYIADEEQRSGIEALREYLTENKITCVSLPRKTARAFAEESVPESLKSLAIMGGRMVPFTPPKEARVINTYGMNETTADVSAYTVQNDGELQPVGKPHFNTRFYIVDRNMHILPAGCIGELCIAGHQVCRGYLHNPEQTAESFIPNPFSSEKGYTRLYRTGDTARWLSDGTIDFIGRVDSLSVFQRVLYNEIQCHPESTFYNISHLRKLTKDCDLARLKTVIEDIISSEKLSRVLVSDNNGVISQDISGDFSVPVLSLTDKEFSRMKDELVQPFHTGEILVRIKLYQTETKKYLLFDASMLLLDGKTILYLLEKIENGYYGSEDGLPCTLRRHVDRKIPAEQYLQEKKFYDEFLSSNYIGACPLSDIHTDATSRNRITREFTLSGNELKKIHSTWKITNRGFFSAVLGYVLSEYLAKNSVTFISHFSEGDYHTQTAFHWCLFATSVKRNTTGNIAEFMQETQENIHRCEQCRSYTVADIINDYHLTFELLFDYTDSFTSLLYYGGEYPATPLYSKNRGSNCKLLISLCELDEERFQLTADYREDVFCAGFISSFVSAYLTAVREFLVKENLDAVTIVSEEELEKINRLNNTGTDYDFTETVVGLLQKQVEKNPEGTAIVFHEKKYTYREMDRISDTIAHYLSEKGIRKEMFVPLLLKRSEYMPLCAIGVMKAGAAYQPIDTSYPKNRVSFMINDVQAKLIIADREFTGLLEDFNGEILYTDTIVQLPEGTCRNIRINPEDACVIIYTSGTTGQAKGCIIEHKNIVAMHENGVSLFKIRPDTRVAFFSNFGFSVSLVDQYTTLCDGGCLYILDEPERHDMQKLETFINENKIASIILTTKLGCLFAESASCPHLKNLYVVGEKLDAIINNGNYAITNIYGSTETTVSICTHRVTETDGPIPIGTANANTKIYVVNRAKHLLPIGAVGMACVAGPQIGREYLNNPEKTDAAFLPNVNTGNQLYSRMYVTGDMVRLSADGIYDFIGREDRQIKIRGFRVELQEIEVTVKSYPRITGAFALIQEKNGLNRIHCFVTGDTKIDTADLSSYIRDRLPYYMVPSGFAQIDAIPFNKNGKIDRARLANITVSSLGKTNPPQTEIQKKIAGKVLEITGAETINITDNLFDAGISSISSMSLILSLSREFGVPLQTSDLREYNTIELLEQHLLTVPLQEEYEKYESYPLSKVQKVMPPDMQLPLLVKINSSIDIPRLKTALCAAVNAHPYILTTFSEERGELIQHRNDSIQFTEEEIEMLSADTIAMVKPSLIEKLNLCGGRLFRIKIIQTSEGNYLFIDMHHMISDGKSYLDILFADISKAYLGNPLIKEKYSYYDFIIQEQRNDQTEKYRKAKQHFCKTYPNLKKDLLFFDRNADSSLFGPAVYTRVSEEKIHERVQEFCTEHDLSLNAFYNAVYGFVVAKMKDGVKSVFFSLHNGRYDSQFIHTVGCFATRFVLSLMPEKTSVLEYIRTVEKQINTMIGNELYAEAEIWEDYQLATDEISSFLYQGDLYNNVSLCGYPAEVETLENTVEEFNVNVLLIYSLFEAGHSGKLFSSCTYGTKRFTPKYIERFVSLMEKIAIEFTKKKMLTEIEY